MATEILNPGQCPGQVALTTTINDHAIRLKCNFQSPTYWHVVIYAEARLAMPRALGNI